MENLSDLFVAIAHNQQDFAVDRLSAPLCDHALRLGLGPVLAHYSSPQSLIKLHNTQPSLWARIQGADKTALVLTSVQFDFLDLLYEQVPELAAQIILLKGAAMALAYYPKPHMRIMGDVDILVPADIQQPLERFCIEQGFTPKSDMPPSYYVNFHHSMPLFHPQKRIWLEVHTALFPPRAHAIADTIFNVQHIFSETKRYQQGAREFATFTPEMTLLYTMNHWCEEHNWLKSGVRLVDIVLIINNQQQKLDWQRIFDWLKTSPQTATACYLLLDFLVTRKIIELPPEILQKAAQLDKNLNVTNKKILHRLMDNYILRGKHFGRALNQSNINILWTTLLYESANPWARLLFYTPLHVLFPVNAKNRFSVRFQLARLRNLVLSRSE